MKVKIDGLTVGSVAIDKGYPALSAALGMPGHPGRPESVGIELVSSTGDRVVFTLPPELKSELRLGAKYRVVIEESLEN